ncbi:hypothetical protein A4E84_03420 [Streptomyces qaidamensis]|uniref:Uncharacterized protein n=1 Tax=Streptomyces qaidamensis TaxID=1783515 RepID=A0A143BUR5_9ACTN|nr:hypothetical protein A4E84_03420 [Streptomyces qaidamensis]
MGDDQKSEAKTERGQRRGYGQLVASVPERRSNVQSVTGGLAAATARQETPFSSSPTYPATSAAGFR